MGASGGEIFVGEVDFKSDSKYIEFSFGGGVGVSAHVVVIPIEGAFEKEYFREVQLPFDLSKTVVARPYVGAPSVQEWIDMLNGEGW